MVGTLGGPGRERCRRRGRLIAELVIRVTEPIVQPERHRVAQHFCCRCVAAVKCANNEFANAQKGQVDQCAVDIGNR